MMSKYRTFDKFLCKQSQLVVPMNFIHALLLFMVKVFRNKVANLLFINHTN